MRIAVIGATGLVGREMLRVLEELGPASGQILPAASSSSAGRKISYRGEELEVVTIEEAFAMSPQVALFSAGSEVSLEWSMKFSTAGTYVIDNSSAWRMDDKVPLIVPEINGDMIGKKDRLIANPNCSTIQLVMALAPLHQRFRVRRVVVATYQSVSGSGNKGLKQLESERSGGSSAEAYPHQIDLNLIPEAGSFEANGYTTEEIKLQNETVKIMGDASIRVTATAVRAPVTGGHSEAVNIEFEDPFTLEAVRTLLSAFPGIQLKDVPARHQYPMPRMTRGSNEVYVGRIRRDPTVENGLNIWIVADNLRKGAATNAVQIALLLIEKGFVKVEGV